MEERVTVAELLSADYILHAVQRHFTPEELSEMHHIYLPPDCLNTDGLLLDDMTEETLSSRLAVPVTAFDHRWEDLIEMYPMGRLK